MGLELSINPFSDSILSFTILLLPSHAAFPYSIGHLSLICRSGLRDILQVVLLLPVRHQGQVHAQEGNEKVSESTVGCPL